MHKILSKSVSWSLCCVHFTKKNKNIYLFNKKPNMYAFEASLVLLQLSNHGLVKMRNWPRYSSTPLNLRVVMIYLIKNNNIYQKMLLKSSLTVNYNTIHVYNNDMWRYHGEQTIWHSLSQYLQILVSIRASKSICRLIWWRTQWLIAKSTPQLPTLAKEDAFLGFINHLMYCKKWLLA